MTEAQVKDLRADRNAERFASAAHAGAGSAL